MNQETHVDTTPLTFLIETISLWTAILEMREIAHGYVCFTGLPTSCLTVSVFFYIQTLQFSCICSLSHFFQRVQVSAHLYGTGTFLRSQDTVTKAINKGSSLLCSLHAMIANVMCPKGYVLDEII